ncbi:hypothetical protein HT136_01330 [Novosphingobium profundi]|uniref:hypothetical protein n=1 Tax=Novosphingobium profundi TaxID=1774954 RepID=UPI001BDB3A65|nr:hypothetical protein [Novosphingobium profundi]MBT0667008.1 hypothetical protein [Novosphingobium profundi]
MSYHSHIHTEASTIGIYAIAKALGRSDYKARRLVSYVSALVREASFPPPLPVLVAQRLEHGVTLKSQWQRDAVDAWLDNFLPPDNALAVDQAAKNAAAAEMDQAAMGLRLVAGGRS